MPRILVASQDATGKITIEGKEVEATFLNEGTLASSGVVLMDRDLAIYLTSSASDIKTLIENLGTVLDKIIQIATTVDGATVPPGGAAANIALLTTLKNQLVAQKDTLK